MDDLIRVGFVSTVDTKTGMVQIYYLERMQTTAKLHLFSMNGEYKTPDIGEQMLVLHLPDDPGSGVVLGCVWGSGAPLQEGVSYRKEFASDAYEHIKDGVYTLRAKEILFETEEGSISMSEIMDLRRRVKRLEDEKT